VFLHTFRAHSSDSSFPPPLLTGLAAIPHVRPALKSKITWHSAHDAPDDELHACQQPTLNFPHRTLSYPATRASVSRVGGAKFCLKAFASRSRDARQRHVNIHAQCHTHTHTHTHLQTLTHSAEQTRVDIHRQCLAKHRNRQANCPSVLSDCHSNCLVPTNSDAHVSWKFY